MAKQQQITAGVMRRSDKGNTSAGGVSDRQTGSSVDPSFVPPNNENNIRNPWAGYDASRRISELNKRY